MLQLSKFKSTYKIKYQGHEVLRFSNVINENKLNTWITNKISGRTSYYNRNHMVYLILKYGQQLVKDYTL